jgi:hypothetical protein
MENEQKIDEKNRIACSILRENSERQSSIYEKIIIIGLLEGYGFAFS